jgi:hypothetical protein
LGELTVNSESDLTVAVSMPRRLTDTHRTKFAPPRHQATSAGLGLQRNAVAGTFLVLVDDEISFRADAARQIISSDRERAMLS